MLLCSGGSFVVMQTNILIRKLLATIMRFSCFISISLNGISIVLAHKEHFGMMIKESVTTNEESLFGLNEHLQAALKYSKDKSS